MVVVEAGDVESGGIRAEDREPEDWWLCEELARIVRAVIAYTRARRAPAQDTHTRACAPTDPPPQGSLYIRRAIAPLPRHWQGIMCCFFPECVLFLPEHIQHALYSIPHKFIHLAFLRYIITMHSVVHIIRYHSQQVPL